MVTNLVSLMGLNSLDRKRFVEVKPGGAVGGGPRPDAVVDGLPQGGRAAHAAAAGAGRVPGQGPARPRPPGQGDVARPGRRLVMVLVDNHRLLGGGGADRSEGGGVVHADRPGARFKRKVFGSFSSM